MFQIGIGSSIGDVVAPLCFSEEDGCLLIRIDISFGYRFVSWLFNAILPGLISNFDFEIEDF